jgi:hypothetical protein
MSRRSWSAGQWTDGEHRRPRVLVEHADGAMRWAAERVLRRAGYDVAGCGGPDENGGPCPLVERGDCALVDGADVIVNGFDLDQKRNRDVVSSLHDVTGDTAIVLSIPRYQAAAHPDLTEGCHVVRPVLSAEDLLENVQRATEA